MRITTLQLQHVRSYKSLDLQLPQEDTVVLLGENGVGKTNLLDAIGMLSRTRSLLGLEDSVMVHGTEAFLRVRGCVVSDAGEEATLEVVLQKSPRALKACFRCDVRIGVEQFLGLLPTVAFLPQDMELLTGAPALRRRFLDSLLCQMAPGYLRSLVAYQRMLKQRSALLRSPRPLSEICDELTLWEARLAPLAARVTVERLALVSTLQLALPEEVGLLGESHWNDVRIAYVRSTQSTDEALLHQEFIAAYAAARDRDRMLQSTTVGPHRDDWAVMVNERSLADVGSRGQQRTVLLALLFLQVSAVQLRLGEKPVILLDDAFSELDAHHQQALLTSLAGYQVILSATALPKNLPEGTAVLHVAEGNVRLLQAVM